MGQASIQGCQSECSKSQKQLVLTLLRMNEELRERIGKLEVYLPLMSRPQGGVLVHRQPVSRRRCQVFSKKLGFPSPPPPRPRGKIRVVRSQPHLREDGECRRLRHRMRFLGYVCRVFGGESGQHGDASQQTDIIDSQCTEDAKENAADDQKSSHRCHCTAK